MKFFFRFRKLLLADQRNSQIIMGCAAFGILDQCVSEPCDLLVCIFRQVSGIVLLCLLLLFYDFIIVFILIFYIINFFIRVSRCFRDT